MAAGQRITAARWHRGRGERRLRAAARSGWRDSLVERGATQLGYSHLPLYMDKDQGRFEDCAGPLRKPVACRVICRKKKAAALS